MSEVPQENHERQNLTEMIRFNGGHVTGSGGIRAIFGGELPDHLKDRLVYSEVEGKKQIAYLELSQREVIDILTTPPIDQQIKMLKILHQEFATISSQVTQQLDLIKIMRQKNVPAERIDIVTGKLIDAINNYNVSFIRFSPIFNAVPEFLKEHEAYNLIKGIMKTVSDAQQNSEGIIQSYLETRGGGNQ